MEEKEKMDGYAEHREKLLAKLEDEEVLNDYELLELLLYYSIPKRDIEEIAHELIHACNGLGNVFHASVKALSSVKGVDNATACLLRTFGAIYDRTGKDPMAEAFQMTFALDTFSEYIKQKYETQRTETLEFYAVDEKSRICYVRSFTTGEKDRVELSPQDITSFIADYDPTGIVVTHNHPDSAPKPSPYDDEFTKLVYVLCEFNKVKLIDHIIVGKNNTYSYSRTGALKTLAHSHGLPSLLSYGK